MHATSCSVPIVSRRTPRLLARVRSIAAALIVVLTLDVAAQTPTVSWAISAYGPGDAPATLGCGSCASDQRSMAVDGAGNVIVTGFTDTSTLSDIMTVKFSGATGAVIWSKTFNSAGSGYDQSWAMALDGAGNAIVTGYTWSGAEYDIKTIKYAAADGAILWQKNFTGPSSGTDFGIAIAVDGAGNAIVGGSVWNGTDDDMKTVKFAAADGTVLWDKTFAGAAGANDYLYAMAVDGAGNVVVTGEATNTALSGPDWKTLKYAAADGAVLWQATFAGAGNGLDIPYGIAIDGANNVFVAGNSHNGADFDAQIVKYAAANGAVLWQKTFVGDGGGDDMFYALALDGAGNAIATGFTFNGTANNDWNTVKFRGSDGATLWAKNFGGSGDLSDVAVAIAVDAAGNAIVGGRVNNSTDPDNRDMQAVRFATSDGALLWSYTHAGSANGFDRVATVAARAGSVFLAGESLETGFPAGWRIVKLSGAGVLKARGDFNGDGRSDILWRNVATGQNYLYPMDGLAILAGEGYLRTVADQNWKVAGIGDFDGDGKADMLWRNSGTGENYIYFMNGSTIKPTEGYLRTVADHNWQVAGVGDFDGDGKDDILWRNAVTGQNYLYPMDGRSIKSSEGYLRTVADTTWQIAGVGDFDGDGKADVLWRNNVSGENYLYLMDGTAIKATEGYLRKVADLGWQVVGIGDYNGDGKADILWRNSTTGENYLYPMHGKTILGAEGYLRTVPDQSWQVKGTGDYDGDGVADILWRNAATGENYLYLMDGTTIKPAEGYLRTVPQPNWQVQNPR